MKFVYFSQFVYFMNIMSYYIIIIVLWLFCASLVVGHCAVKLEL
jgi:hypothetical protein